MTSPKPTLRHIPQLDGIRGIAILLVIAYHSMLWKLGTDVVPRSVHLLLQTTKTGWLGVDLFFVLSGFLITRILVNTRDQPHYFRSFYARRALRILPVFWLTIISVAILYKASAAYVTTCFLFVANLAFLFGIKNLYLPFWSLCVEEHYYLIWPCVVKLVRHRVLPWICVAICIGEPLLRLYGLRIGADILFVSWYRFDGLAYGSLLGLMSVNMTARDFRKWGVILMASGVILCAVGRPFGILDRATPTGAALEFTFSEVLFLGVLSFSLGLGGRAVAVLSKGPLLWSGQLSYCLYLINLIVFDQWDEMIRRFAPARLEHPTLAYFLVRVTCCVAVSFLIAGLSRKFIEQPVLRLKRFFPPSGRREMMERPAKTSEAAA